MTFRTLLRGILFIALVGVGSLLHGQTIAPLAETAPTTAVASTTSLERLPQTASRYDAAVLPAGYAPASTSRRTSGTDGLSELAQRLDAAERELAALKQAQPGGVQPGVTQPFSQASQVQQNPSSVEDDVGVEQRLAALERAAAAAKAQYPLVRMSGFMQFDDGLFSQDPNSRATLGDIQDGVGFRRTRLQALGNLTEFTRFSIEMDFAVLGRPSFMDVWGEQANLPFFGTVRIGQFRQPTTMDALTSIRHLEFLERSAPFQALDPFRRPGIMAYRVSEDEMTTLAYSVFATGFTFYNGTSNVYGSLLDTRFGTEIGDHGGIATAVRLTHLLYYDEPSEGRYLLHVGGGYNFSEIGGNGLTGLDARTYQARSIPEFFVGDPTAGGLTAAGTPFINDTGRILANNYHFGHLELAGNYGSAHFQTEFMATGLNQMNGPMIFYYGAYAQAGYFLTGESVGYNKQTGVLDYNTKPYSEFFGAGNPLSMCGWGAWELAVRWSYLNLAATNITPGNIVSPVATVPPIPNPGAFNESTVALNWWWNQYTRVQFNWIHTMLDNNLHGFSAMDIFATRFQIEF